MASEKAEVEAAGEPRNVSEAAHVLVARVQHDGVARGVPGHVLGEPRRLGHVELTMQRGMTWIAVDEQDPLASAREHLAVLREDGGDPVTADRAGEDEIPARDRTERHLDLLSDGLVVRDDVG